MFDSTAIIEKWLGVRNIKHGRSIQGVDCVGLVYGIYEDQAISLPGKQLNKHTALPALIKLLHQEFIVVHSDYEPGDIVLFQLPEIIHCGVWLAKDMFIHVFGNRGAQLTPFLQWRSKFINAYRLRRLIPCQLL